MKTYQNCNHDNKDTNKFCVKCGTQLKEQPKFCPECGASLITSSKFCTQCGFTLASNSTRSPTSQSGYTELKGTCRAQNNSSICFHNNTVDLVSPMLEVPGENIYMLASSVTQKLYESIMERNPSFFDNDEMNPVESISWYGALCFCNYLSMEDEKEPVYSINGMTDPNNWDFEYYKHLSYPKGITCMEYKGENVIEMNEYANGYRLPTYDEWSAAVDNSADDGWVPDERYDPMGHTHPVMQKEPNSFGFYDLYGNVWEWVWDAAYDDPYAHYFRGNSWRTTFSDVYYSGTYRAWKRKKTLGFRIVCNKI
ncbi:MAG: SUMF1/EgtB/PvdO family nonheme iron enzyme [Treponema sp.]